jgi:peptidoglycan hydrolase-like protein with peptidoglycan-binding domain
MANPSPTRISAPLWDFWTKFDKVEPTVVLGGIFADKPGYHNFRADLPATDYSVEDVAADRRGSSALASGIDLTMSTAAMKKYTAILDKAARARDPRLFIDGVPIIREFIGTLNGTTVYCYVLTGGRQLGVGADAGPDPGRDKSHLWHLHISIIRMFAGSVVAMDRLYSVLTETLAAWQARQPKPPAPAPSPVPVSKPPAPSTGLPTYRNGSRLLEYVPAKPMRGTDVRFVQQWIGTARMGRADGIAGAKFRDGVRWYQRMRGLKVDGVVGRATWRAMGVRPTV